jgi:hypothetical protein
MKKVLSAFALLISMNVLAQSEFKNELGVSLLSFHPTSGTFYLRNKGDNITPISGITYKRNISKHFKARALVGFESSNFVFPEFDDKGCADCGRRSFSSKASYIQAGVQYSYKYKFIEPYVYTDLRYLRSKEYSEYANYAWGTQVGAFRKIINGFGMAFGGGIKVIFNERFSISYEPAIVWQRTSSSGNGVHNGESITWKNVKDDFSEYRPISVFSVNVGF